MAFKISTPAEKAVAEARRLKFRELTAKVAAMTDAERTALVIRAGAVVTCEGRPLSFVNTCLVVGQREGASVVGGFQQWRKTGRKVKKGERALSIWIPRGDDRRTDGTAQPTKEDMCDPGEVKNKSRFFMGTVFDISQTEEIEPQENCNDMQVAQIAHANAFGD